MTRSRSTLKETESRISRGLGRLDAVVWALLLTWVALAVDPFIRAQFTLPKLFGLCALLPIVAVVWIIRVWKEGLRIPPMAVAVAAVLLAEWWAVSSASGIHLSTALFGMPGRYNGLWTHLVLLGLFAMRATSPATEDEIRRTVRWTAYVLLPVALYAVVQFLGVEVFYPTDRPPSTIGHPVILAATLSLAVPLILAELLSATRWSVRSAYGAALLLLLGAIGGTYARGPWLGLAVSLAVVLVARLRGKITWRRVAVGVAAAVVVLGAVAMTMTYVNRAGADLMRARLVNTLRDPLADPSVRSRAVYYDTAVRMIRDHPVMGIGLENYGWLLPRYRPTAGETVGDNRTATMVHNGYLHVGVSSGIPGLIFYVALLTSVIVTAWRAFGPGARQVQASGGLAFAIVAALVGYLVQDLTGWEEISLSVFFWMLLGLCVSWERAVASDARIVTARGPLVAVTIAAAVLGIGSWALSSWAIRGWNAEQTLTRCHELEATGSWASTVGCLDEAIGPVGDRPPYVEEAALFYARQVDRTASRAAYQAGASLLERAMRANPYDSYVAMHRVDLEAMAVRHGLQPSAAASIDSVIEKAHEADPTNPLVDESAARLRLAEGRTAEALTLAVRAQAAMPKEGRVLVLEGDVRRATGDVVGAIADYRYAITLLPANASLDARRKLATSLAQTGKLEEADQEIDRALAVAPRDPLSLTLKGTISLGLHQPAMAKAAFEVVLRTNPADVAARQGLEAAIRELTTPARTPQGRRP